MNLENEMIELKNNYKKILLRTVEEIKNSNSLEDVFENLLLKRAKIIEIRKKYKCNNCASCCKLAISEYSPLELKEKANSGDNFAKQFSETFIPYENIEAAKQIFPEYIEYLEKTTDRKFYIYHCPKVTKDNLCPDYENRPQICRDFPDNPIGFLPLKCAFQDWKKETQQLAMEIKAATEIFEYYKTQS